MQYTDMLIAVIQTPMMNFNQNYKTNVKVKCQKAGFASDATHSIFGRRHQYTYSVDDDLQKELNLQGPCSIEDLILRSANKSEDGEIELAHVKIVK